MRAGGSFPHFRNQGVQTNTIFHSPTLHCHTIHTGNLVYSFIYWPGTWGEQLEDWKFGFSLEKSFVAETCRHQGHVLKGPQKCLYVNHGGISATPSTSSVMKTWWSTEEDQSKVKLLSLCKPWRHMEWKYSPIDIYLSSRWRWAVSFYPQHAVNRRLCGSQSWSSAWLRSWVTSTTALYLGYEFFMLNSEAGYHLTSQSYVVVSGPLMLGLCLNTCLLLNCQPSNF